jgi:hypothetical protein
MIKKALLISGAAILLALGIGAASLVVTTPQAASAHVGNATFDCTKGVQYSFDSFTSGSHKVYVQAYVNGVKQLDTVLTWTGSSYTSDWFPLTHTDASTTYRATGSWQARDNGGEYGNFDTGSTVLDCSKPCKPVTVTITVTQTVPGPTTTIHDTTTLHNTTTVTTPGTTVTAPGVTVTTPGQTVTTPPVTVTTPAVTVTTPGQTVTTPPVTVTTPGSTVTLPAQTVTQTVPGQTVTQTVPGPTTTVTNTVNNTQTVTAPGVTVTTPGQTVTQTVTTTRTVKSPPKVIIKKLACKPKKVPTSHRDTLSVHFHHR